MPVYNVERYIAETIESMLAQTFGDFEFIIVDDGSTDGTVDTCRTYAERDPRIVLIHQPTRGNRGITPTLNEGLRHCRGEFVARMDAGDTSLPERLQRQIDYMRENPQCVALGTCLQQIDEDGDVICEVRFAEVHEEIVETLMGRRCGRALCHACAMIRNRPLQQIGGYRDEFKLAQDRDLWLRLAEQGELTNIPEVLFQVRTTVSSGLSRARGQEQRDHSLRAIRDAYHRHGWEAPETLDLWPVVTDAIEQRIAIALSAARDGHYRTARKHAVHVILRRPLRVRAWRALTISCLGRNITHALGSFRRLLRSLSCRRRTDSPESG